QCREIVWLRCENLLHYLLEFGFTVLIALPFDFLRKRISRTQVLRVEACRFPQVGDRLRGISAIAFKNSQQVVDVVVLRRKITRPLESLGRGVEVSLTQC